MKFLDRDLYFYGRPLSLRQREHNLHFVVKSAIAGSARTPL